MSNLLLHTGMDVAKIRHHVAHIRWSAKGYVFGMSLSYRAAFVLHSISLDTWLYFNQNFISYYLCLIVTLKLSWLVLHNRGESNPGTLFLKYF